jgi:hypothetical protein
MQYEVIPFVANIQVGQGAGVAASQLANVINEYAKQGWEYVRLESVQTIVTTPPVPGSSGCLGIGATPGLPGSRDLTVYYMIVFRK